jgi:two-component system CheB/CheR fusion protein
MPQSSISAGAVDFILSPEGIAWELKKIGRHPYFRPSPMEAAAKIPQEPEENGGYRAILNLLRKSFSVDLHQYKQTTIQRRIHRRMALHNISSLSDYINHLESHPGEVESLYKDMFINVSGFFREPEAFKRLQRSVFPKLLKGRPADSPIRVWVPGCSTGEEAYSLAISLLEFVKAKSSTVQIQIFATDISPDAIEKGRKGHYLHDINEEVSPERLRRWFMKTEDGYQISKTVRDVVIFAIHDATKNPPFSRLDLVSCRNLLIYLGPELQQKLIPVFHYALKPNGYLFLGVAESVGAFHGLFTPVDKKFKIYLKRQMAARAFFELGGEHWPQQGTAPSAKKAPESQQHSAEALKLAADLMVLNEYAPPSVLVNEEAEILQFRGRTGYYLEPASGAPTLNLLKMSREGLLPELRAAFLEAQKKNIPVLRERIKVNQNGDLKVVDLYIAPVKTSLAKERYFLVMFRESSEQGPSWPTRAGTKKKTVGKETVSPERFLELKQEQVATKTYLESVVAKLEASNDELRSLNEEIQSSGEELQSTHEELETANEELQSANEELTTMNEELHNRNQELSRANNDILNILASMNLSLVFVDPGLRIRRFTPTAHKVFNLIPSDVGRPISDISFKSLRLPNFADLVRDVIAGNSSKEEEVQDEAGHWYLLQVRPYTTTEKEIEGAVIALVDINARVTREAEMEESAAQLARVTEDSQQAKDQLRSVHRRLHESSISKERDALAREMHDGLGQVLTGVVVQLDALDSMVPVNQDPLRRHISKAREVAREGLQQVRRTAWAWHSPLPLQAGQLEEALEHLGHRLFDSTPIVFYFSKQGHPRPLAGPVETNLIMLAQEALVNVLRHSEAREVRVDLRFRKDEVRLEVADKGKGFDPETASHAQGFGLISMQERAQLIGGRFSLETQPGQGTRIEVVVPLEKK